MGELFPGVFSNQQPNQCGWDMASNQGVLGEQERGKQGQGREEKSHGATNNVIRYLALP